MDEINETISKGFNILTEKLEGWIEAVIKMLPNFLIASVVFIAFLILSKYVYRWFNNIIDRSHLNKNMQHLVGSSLRIITLGLGVVICLGILDLQKTVFSLLAGVGVIGLALGFAFQDLASNFISGVMMAVSAPIRVGDLIKIQDTMGHVIEIRLRDTLIRNFEGQDIFIPNKDFTTNQLINYSSFGRRRVRIEVGIRYEDDPQQAIQIIKNALSKVNNALKDPEPEAFVVGFGDSSVNLYGQVWFKYPGENIFQIQNDAIVAIKKDLEEAGLSIPFPIRTIDLNESTKKSLLEFKQKD